MAAPVAGSAKVKDTGIVVSLGSQPQPAEVVTTDDVKDPSKLAQVLGRLLKTVSDLRRQWNPRNVDFEDVVMSGGGTQYSFQHNLGGRARWWVVGWQPAAGGTAAPALIESPVTPSDGNTLYLRSYVAGTATIRIEEAG